MQSKPDDILAVDNLDDRIEANDLVGSMTVGPSNHPRVIAATRSHQKNAADR